ncbi:MAG: Cache 3/Cache 2 fusion domain-containing protein [Deltaproteobacteria bacterium]|nr:Cache 3/Cache 2 fusion domain-containing protein [Deltaproteobacteria bacterium]
MLFAASAADKLSTIFSKKTRIGQTGFLFILDSKGNLVIHKKAQGQYWIKKLFIKHIANIENGYYRYISPKTNTYTVTALKLS